MTGGETAVSVPVILHPSVEALNDNFRYFSPGFPVIHGVFLDITVGLGFCHILFLYQQAFCAADDAQVVQFLTQFFVFLGKIHNMNMGCLRNADNLIEQQPVERLFQNENALRFELFSDRAGQIVLDQHDNR